MLDPAQLVEVAADLPELGEPVLVQAMAGFIDAGSATRLAREHLLRAPDSRVIARFDVDQLYDYRARRPAMSFVEDHWDSYDDPVLALYLVHDAAGTPYLLLAGPEPDVQWERFVAAVQLVVERLGVRLVIGLTAIPMAVPHTRPVGVIAHGNPKELISGYDAWVHTVQVPASAGHLLEYRLGQAGRDSMGFAVHVPHYLTQAEYPDAAEMLLSCVARAGGLVLPTEELRAAAATTRTDIDAQVAQSPEIEAVVRALETQYDAFVTGRGLLVKESGMLPTGDELGAELERFLAEQSGTGEAHDS
jgi:hypothetical protein